MKKFRHVLQRCHESKPEISLGDQVDYEGQLSLSWNEKEKSELPGDTCIEFDL